MDNIAKQEISGMRDSLHIPDEQPVNPDVFFFEAVIEAALRLVAVSEFEGSDYMVKDNLQVAFEARNQITKRFSPLSFFTIENLLNIAAFTGVEEHFECAFSHLQTLSKDELVQGNNPNYFFYKCLIAVKQRNFDQVREIISSCKKKKIRGMFLLPASYDAIEALVMQDEQSFLIQVDTMRAQYAEERNQCLHNTILFTNYIIPRDIITLVKVAEGSFGKDLAQNLPRRIDTFKFKPNFCGDLDISVVGEFEIDYCFPLRFWNKPWVNDLVSKRFSLNSFFS